MGDGHVGRMGALGKCIAFWVPGLRSHRRATLPMRTFDLEPFFLLRTPRAQVLNFFRSAECCAKTELARWCPQAPYF
jgi:hypothetical protein